MLILKSDISAVRRKDLETDCELLWTEIIKDSLSIMLGVFYRPPGSGTVTPKVVRVKIGPPDHFWLPKVVPLPD